MLQKAHFFYQGSLLLLKIRQKAQHHNPAFRVKKHATRIPAFIVLNKIKEKILEGDRPLLNKDISIKRTSKAYVSLA
jgi:hypothetical protein